MSVGNRIVVTGGAGFLGAHLCSRLVAEKRAVVCIDNFTTGREMNIRSLLDCGRFELVRHDVSLPWTAVLPEAEVDLICNLASPASPVHYQRRPLETLRTNVLGTMHALEWARKSGATLLQASTSEVYGDPLVHPQREGDLGNVNPIGPRACYDEGKRCAETLCFDYARVHGVGIKVARIFNTYGPGMRADDGRVVSSFIVQALTGAPITVHGDGSQTRSFCYVDDMIDGLLMLAGSAPATTGPVNLGNPAEVSMLHLAEQVVALTGSRSALRFLPLPGDDPRRRRPDIARAEAQLGWRPMVGLAEGLARTIDYFDRLLASEGTEAVLCRA